MGLPTPFHCRDVDGAGGAGAIISQHSIAIDLLCKSHVHVPFDVRHVRVVLRVHERQWSSLDAEEAVDAIEADGLGGVGLGESVSKAASIAFPFKLFRVFVEVDEVLVRGLSIGSRDRRKRHARNRHEIEGHPSPCEPAWKQRPHCQRTGARTWSRRRDPVA